MEAPSIQMDELSYLNNRRCEFVWTAFNFSFTFSFLFIDVKDQFYCYNNNHDCRLVFLKNNDARRLDFLFKNQGLILFKLDWNQIHLWQAR